MVTTVWTNVKFYEFIISAVTHLFLLFWKKCICIPEIYSIFLFHDDLLMYFSSTILRILERSICWVSKMCLFLCVELGEGEYFPDWINQSRE